MTCEAINVYWPDYKRIKRNYFFRKAVIKITLLLASFFCVFPVVGVDMPSEQEMKVVYVFNFLKFIDWSGSELASAPHYVICLKDIDDEYDVWKKLNDKTLNSKKIVIKNIDSYYFLETCHVLFVKFENERDVLFGNREKSATVIITESEEFYQKNGMIYLFLEENKLRFSMDVLRLERTGVKVSSHLLRLAKEVKKGKVSQ